MQLTVGGCMRVKVLLSTTPKSFWREAFGGTKARRGRAVGTPLPAGGGLGGRVESY